MDSKEALEFINRLFKKRTNQVLNELETTLFLGFWEDKSYKEIVTQTHWTEQHLRDTGAKLCQKITKVIERQVTKKNFKKPIEDRYKEYSPNIPPQESPSAEQEKFKPTPNVIGSENGITNPFIPQNGRGYYFDGVWAQAARGAAGQQVILRAIAPHIEGLSLKALAQSTNIDTADLQPALNIFKRHDVVEEIDGQWQIIVELFRRWVLQL